LELNYLLVRSKKRKKTISLQVRKDGSVVIQAPWRTSGSDIDSFFHSKQEWILKKIGQREKIRGTNDARKFISGETFLYLGTSYPLIVNSGNNGNCPLIFSSRRFILGREYVHQAKALFIDWYREEARSHIEERIRHFSDIFKLYPGRIRIGSAISRWGSCSSGNHLSFTWRLVMAPGSVIDYVVAHELAHIKEKNHSNRFWNLVERAVPDYRVHRLWLRQKGHLLNV
jgi:predicted metal-dependent hydrolase